VREIPVGEVADTVRRLCIEADHELRGDQVDAFPSRSTSTATATAYGR
jgi:hypothetical protein